MTLLPENDRPRERMLLKGPEALSDAELLAIVLRTGSRGKNAVELAQELLSSNNGSLEKVFSLPLPKIMENNGIGESKALQGSLLR